MRDWTALAVATVMGFGWAVPASAAPRPDPPALAWQDCGNGVSCASMTVPVDWGKRDGATTLIDVAKVPARSADRRVGSLVVNLGAGNSTSALLAGRPPSLDGILARLTENFDVVVFDPRGLGRTVGGTQVSCPVPAPDLTGLIRARGEANWADYARQQAAYDDSCRAAAGAAFDGLDSWQIAHDLDALRAALGEQKLRYFGNSYGTTYAQAYVELFPERVERMYLDGVADHTQPRLEDWLRNYALTQEQQLLRFRAWCDERPDCALYGREADKVWDELVARATRNPLPAPSAGNGKTVGVEQLFAGALVGMNPAKWPELALAMAQARDGDAGRFLTTLRFPPEGPTGNVMRSLLCHDFMPRTPSYREFLGIERRLKAVAPRFGWIEGRFELARCVGIAGQPAYRPHPLVTGVLPPILVGIGELDNSTNNLGAVHVADQLPGARKLWHGDGHAAYLLGNRCLAGHVERYLLDGTLPAEGTRCPGELIAAIPGKPA